VGADRVFLLDGECVDSVDDYEPRLRELLQGVSGGTLSLTDFDGVEGPRRKLTLGVSGSAPVSFEAEGATDWFDNAAVVEAINRVLQQRGEPRRLVQFHEEPLGQLAGWVLLTSSQFGALLQFGLESGAVSVCFDDGKSLSPASEDRGGDASEWESLISER
jgi:hypothetical protein